MLDTQNIIAIVKQVVAQDSQPIALHEPHFIGNEWAYVKECLDTGWVSSVGKFVDRFEQDLCTLTGAKHAVVTVNGTAALHMAYLLAGVMPGDEVLVPALTFVGTINPVMYCGAVPHFIDAEATHLGIDPVALDDYLGTITERSGQHCINRNTQRPIRALCVMHTLGHPVDLDPLLAVCEKYRIALIEDAAEALGSYYKGTHVGHHGLLGTLSFNGNKVITTGGGGAILTNNTDLAKHAKHMTTTAKQAHPWLFEHDQVGYNYRLPNINAALGCAQLEQLSDFLQAKRTLAQAYQRAFSEMTGLQVIQEPSFAKSNYWLNAICLDERYHHHLEPLLLALNTQQLMARPLWNLQSTLPMYQSCPRMPLPVAEGLSKRVIKVPSSPQLMLQRPTTEKVPA